MTIEQAKKCIDCNGIGEVNTMEKVYPNEPHEAPIGSEKCEHCGGSGIDPDDEVVLERIIENLDDKQEEKIQEYFLDNYGGEMGVCKDNFEDIYEGWLSNITLLEIEKILQ